MAKIFEKLRKYTNDERSKALRLSDELGASKAAAQLGMPVSTLWNWRSDEKKKRDAAKSQDVAMPPSLKQSEPVTAQQVDQDQAQQPQGAPPKRKQVAKVYTPSQRAEALERLAVEGAVKTSRKLGISRFSLHEWARKQHAFEQGQATDRPLRTVPWWVRTRTLPARVTSELSRSGQGFRGWAPTRSPARSPACYGIWTSCYAISTRRRLAYYSL